LSHPYAQQRLSEITDVAVYFADPHDPIVTGFPWTRSAPCDQKLAHPADKINDEDLKAAIAWILALE
jgi:hypothetical protein